MVAIAVAIALGIPRAGRSPVEGTWLLYDGVGTEIIVFDSKGRISPEPGLPASSGSGSLTRNRFSFTMGGLRNPSGDTYTRTFEGTRVEVPKGEIQDLLPRGLASSAVEAAYAGTMRRTDMPDFAIPVVAFILTPEFSKTPVVGRLMGTPPPAAPPPPPPVAPRAPTTTPAPPPAGPAPAGRIVFHGSADGSLNVHVVNADGSGQVRLTRGPSTNYSPSWSPDGSQIVFVSNRDRGGAGDEVYVMQADGSGTRRVTEIASFKGSPTWSPDGRRLAFSSGPAGPGPIFIINVDGTGLAQFTPFTAAGPVWSPDGEWLAFTCYEEKSSQVCLMNADGRQLARLTPASWNALGPDWSPDGTKLVFARDNQVYVMNRDGSQAVRLTEDRGFYPAPTWSPNGQHIAFVSNREGEPAIYVMNADGTGQRRIMDIPFGPLDWGP